MPMKIASVRATPLNLPVTMGQGDRAKSTFLSLCIVDVELDDGRIGTGMTAITEEEVVASIVNDIASHALVGMDPLRHEQLQHFASQMWSVHPLVHFVQVALQSTM